MSALLGRIDSKWLKAFCVRPGASSSILRPIKNRLFRSKKSVLELDTGRILVSHSGYPMCEIALALVPFGVLFVGGLLCRR